MECLLCLEMNDVSFRLMSEEGLQQNIQAILKKYFSSCITVRPIRESLYSLALVLNYRNCLKQISDDKNTNICVHCWQKVKDFDEFYVHIESVHRYLSMPVLAMLPIAEEIKLENDEPELNELDNEISLSEHIFPTKKSKPKTYVDVKNEQISTRTNRSTGDKRPTKRTKKSVQAVRKSRMTSDSEMDDPSFECGNGSSGSDYEQLGTKQSSGLKRKRQSSSNSSDKSRNRKYVSDKTPHR